ncbi:MAG: HEAT repeat domain-containing protein [Verrucomicrobia bacterium]|nr:HEAT repeat domain-containing protein [Verrucomicrobiota bacterium]
MRTFEAAVAIVGLLLCAVRGWAGERLPGIVFVADDIYGPHHLMEDGRSGTAHWREGYIFHRGTSSHPLERTTTPTRPGRNLYTLMPAQPDGTLRRITHLTNGEVFNPEPSYDGRRILFSLRRDGEDWFNLYEIGADGRNLVQLTDGPFNDISGVYLPDGRIVFVSDRAGYLDEYHEERTETLWIMEAGGTGMQQLTFNPGTVFDPTVLQDGRILFTLWDTFHLNVPPLDKHENYLMTIRPDGTEESHFFGIGQYRFFSRERHSGLAYTQARERHDGTFLVLTELGPSILDPRQGLSPEKALWPVFPGTTTIQLGGATHRVHLSPTGSKTTPYPLPDGRFLFSATPPGARDLGIYVADPKTRAVQLVFNRPNTAEFDARPILLERPRPVTLAPKAAFSASKQEPARDRPPPPEPALVPVTGRSRQVVVNARRSDNPNHAAVLERVRYYRVIEALPTAVTSSSHTNLATRILGVVPVLPDGSAYYEAPADTPLYVEPLDAAQRRIAFDWNYPVTSVPFGSPQNLIEMTYVTSRPGETKSCHGCHAPLDHAPAHAVLPSASARDPVRIERDVTDIIFRRNEPEEYRCQARVGDEVKCRAWLASPDPELRRQGCEMLMNLEDGARPEAGAIARLLGDPSIAVRRAAALALTRLGTSDTALALCRALDDADWQVRFHAGTALEAITACLPPGGAGAAEGARFHPRLMTAVGGARGLAGLLGKGPAALGEHGQPPGEDLNGRWFEAIGRLGAAAPDAARHIVRAALQVPVPPPFIFEPVEGKRRDLGPRPPALGAIRAAGWTRDALAVPLLIPWLTRPEYQDHACEAALALGRIGTPPAIEALWRAVHEQVPKRTVYLSRYFLQGPRPEEYAYLHGLVLAGAKPALPDVPLVIGLLPGTFLEKPRFEDRLRPESQRVLLVRRLLENAGHRQPAVGLLTGVLRGDPAPDANPLYQKIREGINLERPFSEHGRAFPVVKTLAAEQALWLLGCLTTEPAEVPAALITPSLASANERERIDAAVLLHRIGFDAATAAALHAEAAKPYGFKEIMSIGKGRVDPDVRDKCYLVMALARHAGDVAALRTFADPKTRYRDVRYGLAVGLGTRARADGIGLLVELATRDPIAAVRRQALESLRSIQQSLRLAGETVPEIALPEPMPFEAWYSPRGLSWPGPVVETRPDREAPEAPDLATLEREIAEGLRDAHYRNLNNSNNQAPGAKRMMVSGIDSLDRAVAALAAHYPEHAAPALRRLLESPNPFAQYLALRELLAGRHPELNALLLKKLDAFAKAAETVGFHWTCEALARRGVVDALPALARFARAESPPGMHGPSGMGLGYPAAKAIARLAPDLGHPEVRRLLESENIWLRAGALAGLTEARAPGIETLLARVLAEHPAALVADQAAVGLRTLQAARQAAVVRH